MRLSFGLLPFVVGCATVFGASLCQAQASPSVEGRGKHSIAVQAGANTLVGLGVRTGTRTDVILEVGGRVSDGDGVNGHTIVVGPSLKRYWGSLDGSVAPYLLLGLRAEWSEFALGSGTPSTSRRIGGVAGLGLDWFPTQRVSVGGHLGVEALAVRSEGPTFVPGADPVSTGHEIGTFSSGVRLRLFF
jgi:hypothetical protein